MGDREALSADTVNPSNPPGPFMPETCSVHLEIQLPREIAAQAEKVQQSDPEFLSRVILYGLTRRSVYRQLRDGDEGKQGKAVTPPLIS